MQRCRTDPNGSGVPGTIPKFAMVRSLLRFENVSCCATVQVGLGCKGTLESTPAFDRIRKYPEALDRRNESCGHLSLTITCSRQFECEHDSWAQ
jgi:hypothetical protein